MCATSLTRHAIRCIAVALLAGCGGSQPPTNTPAVGRPALHLAQRVRSDGLLYAGGKDGNLYVYSYPSLQPRYTIHQPANAGVYGECTDAAGDVFVTTREPSSYVGTIYEYQHGATTPETTLSDPGEPYGCAVDPTTGNLAVSNYFDHYGQFENLGEILIYPKDGSAPQSFAESGLYKMYFCGYDGSGNLFFFTLAGENPTYQLYEITHRDSVTPITLNTKIVTPGAIQWNAEHLTITDLNQGTTPGPELVYTLKLRHGSATVIATRKLDTPENWHFGQTLIDGGNVLAIPVHTAGKDIGKSIVSMWTYPSGPGRAYRSTRLNTTALFGLAISPDRTP